MTQLTSDYINYRKKKMAAGGQMTQDATGTSINYGAIAAGVGGVADGIDQGNSLGRQHTGTTVLKGAAAGASLGSVVGPWGTAIGAVVGAGYGLIAGGAAKRKEARYTSQLARNYNQQEQNRSMAEIGANPDEVTGNTQTGGYYADGGELGGDKPNVLMNSTDYNTYQNVNNVLGSGKAPLSTGYGKNLLGNKALIDDLTIYNQRADVQKMSPEQRITSYYNTQSNNPEINTLRSRYRTMGSGPVASYNSDPTISRGTPTQGMAKLADGGQLKPLSSTAVDVDGPSHADGGVQIGPNEVEGNETIDNNYVFSDKLGFAAEHRPLAKAMGKIEQKPYSAGTVNSLRRMGERVEKLKQAQEFVKEHFKP